MAEQIKVQRMRYSDTELSLIKATFADQNQLMVLVRKFLIQGKLTEFEADYLSSVLGNPDVLALIKKAVYPPLEKGAPSFQTVDLYSNLALDGVPMDHAVLVIKARQLADLYLSQRFQILEAPVKAEVKIENEIKFDDLIKPNTDQEVSYIGMLARNFLLSHIDTQLFSQLMIIAGRVEETSEQQKRRLDKDSSK